MRGQDARHRSKHIVAIGRERAEMIALQLMLLPIRALAFARAVRHASATAAMLQHDLCVTPCETQSRNRTSKAKGSHSHQLSHMAISAENKSKQTIAASACTEITLTVLGANCALPKRRPLGTIQLLGFLDYGRHIDVLFGHLRHLERLCSCCLYVGRFKVVLDLTSRK